MANDYVRSERGGLGAEVTLSLNLSLDSFSGPRARHVHLTAIYLLIQLLSP